MKPKRARKRKELTNLPLLSAVEWMAVQVYLEHRVAVANRELETWRQAYKLCRNSQTISSVRYHRDALTALERSLAWVRDYVPRAQSAGTLPPPTLSTTDLVARN